MRAQTDQHQNLWFARTVCILRILGLFWLRRIWILQIISNSRKRFQRRLRSTDHKYRSSAPCRDRTKDTTLFYLADINPNRGTRCARFGAGIPGTDEGHYRAYDTGCAHNRG